MKRILVLLLISCLFFSQRLSANHLLGGEISYKFISASANEQRYKVTLSFFADCSSNVPENVAYPALINADPLISLYKGNVLFSSLNLSYDAAASNVEITPVCPDEAANTTCIDINNPLPGIKLFVYSGDFILKGTDANWRFAFSGRISSMTVAGRSLIIQNAQIGGQGSIMYLEATLNNTIGINNAPTFTSLPAPFFCLNKPATYSLGAADPENDQLTFSLIAAKEVTNSQAVIDVTYVNPFTALKPVPSADADFNFNNSNGQMNFRPNLVRNCIVTNLVEEYRNGVKVGSCMREMIFVILNNCNNDAPLSPVSGIENANIDVDASGNLKLSVCEGQSANIAFDINCSDPNGDNTTITYSNLPEGATITVDNNGTLQPRLHFLWSVYEAVPGDYLFYVTYTDDGCPLRSTKTIAYTIHIVEHAYKFFSGTTPACPQAADGQAWAILPEGLDIDYEYRWVDAGGNTVRTVHRNTGDTLAGVPAGTYKVYIRNSEGCGTNITLEVAPTPLPEILLPPDTFLCDGMPMALNTTSQENISYSWNTGADGCCITVTEPGIYILTASNRCGDVQQDSAVINYVRCNFCLFVPNAFTPNGDGKNDRFNILETCIIRKYKLQLFNRWGQLVFTSLSTGNSWDGWYKGQEAESGTYYYIIEAVPEDTGKGTITLRGDLTLIR